MVVNFVLPVIMKIGEYLVAPVGRQFAYLIFYDRNIKNLEKQVQKLEDKRFGVQKSVEEAEAKRETIAPGVERWLKTVNDLNEEAKKFLEVEVKANKGCLNGWCPNLKSRYSLSRKATKKTQSVEELCGEGVFSTVSYPTVVPSVGTTFAFTGGFKGFESRRSIMNGVMEALTDDSIYVIGICGLGGVGKTTMVNEVAKKVEEKKMFDIIVMVVVSQNPNLITIQGQIAKILNLQDFGGNNLPTGAGKIQSKLLSFGRVLVILDDVWKRLELNDIGISFGDNHKGCKIVMTSRNKDVCNSMGTHENFEIGVLHKEEAWNLFKEMAEISDEGASHPTGLQLTQMEVAKECGGLPIAIATVGRALRCKNKYSWDSALQQLRKSMVKNITEVEEKVFKPLKLSYDYLESDEAKNCFLLCCLYPEDFDIPLEDLVRYAIGKKLFDQVDSVNDARNRVYSLVDKLKNCYLLMESGKSGCIKMHDVVRDVAMSIASRDEHSFLVRCDEVLKEWPESNRLQKHTAISLKVNGMHWLPSNLKFPNLQLLLLDCNAGLPSYNLNKGMEKVKVQETPDSFYQGMEELKVLALSNMYSSLPTSLRRLTNLRTLSLLHCRLINDDISIIGALENLEILRFGGSYIKELPKELIGHLAHLKVLDLLECVVERIYPGVLKSLSKLEELYVGSNFQSWCAVEESKEGAKAIIDELVSLSNLVALDIALINISFWPRGLVIKKLKKFNICVGIHFQSCISVRCSSLSNQLQLGVENMSHIIEMGLNFLLKSTEILTLNSSVKGLKILCDLVGEDGFECLTNLSLAELYDLEYLINTADGVPQSVFPVLEGLYLYKLDKFKGITSHECRLPNKAFSALKVLTLFYLHKLTNLWKGPTQLVWLGNLTTVNVTGCNKLESMFPLSIARNLVQLQELQIHGCGVMEEIVSSKGVEHEIAEIATDKIEFPKLKKLCLQYLPSLTAICKAMNAIELPQLSSLSLSEMPKLKRLCPASDSESNCDPIIQPLFNDKDKLATIEELTIYGMENLTEIWPGELEAKLRKMTVEFSNGLSSILFPSNSIKGMQNLEVLEVKDCRSIGVAFDLEGLVWEGILDMVLPSLKKVKLSCLSKLTHVWKDNSPGIQGFQNLRSLVVNECDSLRNLFSYSLAKLLVKLQEIEVTECGMMESIIGNEPNADDAVITNMIMFPQLSSLKLSDLPNLTSFCFEACTFEGSLLKTIEVINCPKMKILPSAFQRKLEQQKADFSTSSQLHLLDGKIIMGRKRKPDHPRRMMSDVLHNRTSVAPPSEEASYRPPLERPVVPPPSDQPSQRPLLLAPPLEEASQQPPSEGPLVPPHRPPSVAAQQLPCTRPPRLPSVRPPSGAPQQLSSRLELSAYEPSADLSTSSQPTSGHVSSSLTSTRRGRGCAKGIREWGTGKKMDIQFDENYCPIGDNVAKLTTQLGIIVRNGNIVPLTFLDWNNVPDDIVDAIWKDVKDNLNICPEEYKPICMKNCNSIWKDHKNKIKAKYFKPRSSDTNLKDDVPVHIVPSQWEELVEYWRTSDAEKIATRNSKNRRAHGIAHTTGRTTFAQIRHEMTNKGESTDKMNVWLMTRRVDDPEVIQTEDEFNRQLSLLPEDCRTLEARNATFHELIGHDGHGYCRTYERTVPRRAVYKDGAGPSQSTPQPSTIVQITQQVRAELRDELREELRAEFATHLQQMRAEMMALVSQGASVDPNRQVPDASSGHRAFRESAEDENPYTPPPEDQIFPE